MNIQKLGNPTSVGFAALSVSIVLLCLYVLLPATSPKVLEQTLVPDKVISEERLVPSYDPLTVQPAVPLVQPAQSAQQALQQLEMETQQQPQQYQAHALAFNQEDYSKQKVYYTDKVIVLTYHHIDEKENGITISPKRFKSHMQRLKKEGYNVISMEHFLHFIKSGAQVPQNAVLITFDDGYESFYTQAYPELLRLGFHATKFIVVDSIDHPKSPRLTWDQMREMKENGMSFYSHTYDHHDKVKAGTGSSNTLMPMLTNPIYVEAEQRLETDVEYRTRIKQDLLKAEKRIGEELGPQYRLLAFPFGAYNNAVLEVGKAMGIELFFTTQEGINHKGSTEIYRVHAGAAYVSEDDLMWKMKLYHKK
ncbi:polysaccharide deacetylase family protein [Paenibacillus oryzisoli]|uniref:NodB homology domain-containing protein n=1 Tax=Paenibacillus oryzisoli TaxID=1850517 RepID=A0A198A164_9BACL|nr:polysaccharide deacetylase family protein [Paenibacillus oryzisoli]OAS14753.1 hypothetical protein A8708_23950 [Paenibacillus oryzisoli]